jgi:hypothetical protein
MKIDAAKRRAERMTIREWNDLRERVFANQASKWQKAIYRAGFRIYGGFARK